jgi:hypothetical protein
VLRTVRYRSVRRDTDVCRPGARVAPQPRPAFGLVPWLALEVRAFCFFFDVRFDIGMKCYPECPRISEA